MNPSFLPDLVSPQNIAQRERPSSKTELFLWILIYNIYLCLFQFVLLPKQIFQPLEQFSQNLFTPALGGSFFFLVFFLGFQVFYQKRKFVYFGLQRNQLKTGIWVLFFFWSSLQFAVVIWALQTQQPLYFIFSKYPWEKVIGKGIGQIFGNALLEQVFFNAFLLVQFRTLIENSSLQNKTLKTGLALFLIATLFALSHLPGRIAFGMYSSFEYAFQEQCFLLLLGLLWGGVFLKTKNLWIAIGVHALNNFPFVFYTMNNGIESGMVKIGTLFLLLFYPSLIPKKTFHFLKIPKKNLLSKKIKN